LVRGSGWTCGDVGLMPWEKSDHLIRARSPGNAGGAKWVMR
jgi:hypothetical protein